MTLELRPGAGAEENLALLRDPASGVKAAFLLGGNVPAAQGGDLVSLGAGFYEPLWLFTRGDAPRGSLAALKGRRISIGVPGSGSHAVAEALLRLRVDGNAHVRGIIVPVDRRHGQAAKPRKAKDETDEFILDERANDQTAIMDSGDENMRGHNVGFTAWPYDALQVFNEGHLFGGFKQFDNESRQQLKLDAVFITIEE